MIGTRRRETLRAVGKTLAAFLASGHPEVDQQFLSVIIIGGPFHYEVLYRRVCGCLLRQRANNARPTPQKETTVIKNYLKSGLTFLS
jgi:hypothetical protein